MKPAGDRAQSESRREGIHSAVSFRISLEEIG